MRVILGAGLCGLALAYYLRDPSVVILEASDRPGGWVRTENLDGLLLERGPHGFFAAEATLQLCRELNLELIEAPALPRYRWRHRKLHPFQPLPKGHFQLEGEDESVESFCMRHHGAEITRELIDPMVLGIYGAPPAQLSFRCAFPEGLGAPRTGGLYGLQRGMQSLTDALATRLESQIRFNQRVTGLKADGTIQLERGALQATQIYSTLAAPALGQLLGDETLAAFPMTSLHGASLAYHQGQLPVTGVGHLVPSCESSPLLGIFYASSLFPQQNQNPAEIRLTLFARNPLTRSEALELVEEQLQIKESPDHLSIWSAPNSIPRYPVGWSARSRQYGRITALGACFGPCGVNGSIAQARAVSS